MKNKKSIKFNAIDFLICTLILLIAFFGVRYSNNQRNSPYANQVTHEAVEIVIESDSINDIFVYNINIGDTVIEADTGLAFGNVRSINTADVTFMLDNGKVSIIPGVRKVKLSVVCDSEYNGSYYLVNGRKIIIGENYELLMPGLYISGECVLINSLDTKKE